MMTIGGIRERVDPLDSGCQNIRHLETSGDGAMQLMSVSAAAMHIGYKTARSCANYWKRAKRVVLFSLQVVVALGYLLVGLQAVTTVTRVLYFGSLYSKAAATEVGTKRDSINKSFLMHHEWQQI